MRRLFVVLALASLLAGCVAQSVQELKSHQGAIKREARSNQPPERSIACVSRNFEEASPGIVQNIRTGVEPGSWELVLTLPAGFMMMPGHFAYALATPAPGGSQVTVWMNNLHLSGAEAAQAALKGC